jgi:hypothetical protein
VTLGAVVLTAHLLQHVAEGIGRPAWFFALGIVGAAGLWATAALWPRGSDGARTLVLALLGLGLVWGGLAEHLREAAADGLTATHATGVLAGGIGVALLAIAATRLFAGDRPGPPAGGSPGLRS